MKKGVVDVRADHIGDVSCKICCESMQCEKSLPRQSRQYMGVVMSQNANPDALRTHTNAALAFASTSDEIRPKDLSNPDHN